MKSFGPAIFPFCSPPPLPVINDQSLMAMITDGPLAEGLVPTLTVAEAQRVGVGVGGWGAQGDRGAGQGNLLVVDGARWTRGSNPNPCWEASAICSHSTL